MTFNMEEETNKQPEITIPVKDESNEKKLHDRTCPYCKQTYKTKIGTGNWKNLFRKPTLDDWITLIILALLILAAFSYSQETGMCRAMTSNMEKTCMDYYAWKNNRNQTNSPLLLPNYTIQNDSNIIVANNNIVNDSVNDSNSSGNVIGGEKDEHGCIIPAGYSWCESLQKCIRPWETNCTGEVTSSKVGVNVTTMSNSSTNASISQ